MKKLDKRTIRILVIAVPVLFLLLFLLPPGEEVSTRQQALYGSLENPFILSNTGDFLFTLDDPDGVKVVKLTSDVSPEWRVIDFDRVVLVKIFDLEAKRWSDWSEFTLMTTDRYIPDKRYKLIKFKAKALGSGETVRIVVIGAPYGAT